MEKIIKINNIGPKSKHVEIHIVISYHHLAGFEVVSLPNQGYSVPINIEHHGGDTCNNKVVNKIN